MYKPSLKSQKLHLKTVVVTVVVILIISSCHHTNKRTETIEIVAYAHEFHILMVNIAMPM